MPETATLQGEAFSAANLCATTAVLGNRRFLCGALAIGFASLPLLARIAQSPVILISGESLSTLDYGLQNPGVRRADPRQPDAGAPDRQNSVERLIKLGAGPMLLGLLIAALATQFSSHAYLWMTAGLSLYAFGIGLANAGLYRLTLFSSNVSRARCQPPWAC